MNFIGKNMTKRSIILLVGIISLSFSQQSTFLVEQKKFINVRTAISEKQLTLEKVLNEKKISLNDVHILFVAYKENDRIDVYVKNKNFSTYTTFKSYPICARSGNLGPKVQQGDGQVPEGFYQIDRFNPSSNFYLSLGLNYPNLADKRRTTTPNLGGDIFIHGACVTIGCLPITDNFIKELYTLAIHAKNNGQSKIPVYIFPFEMTNDNFTAYKAKNIDNKKLIDFWSNLKIGHDIFLKGKKELSLNVSENGRYQY